MKKISMIIVLLLFAIAAAAPAAQKGEDKLRAFTASVKEETAKNYPRAIQSMLDIIDSHRSDYLVNLRLGWLYYLSRDYDNSVKYYQEAIRISDNSIDALLGITLPYAEMKKWDMVQDAYKSVLAKDKAHYTANLRMGQIYFNVANYVVAKKYFETAYENYPSDYEVNLYMGWTYYYLGSRSKAQQFFVNAMILNSNETSAAKGLELTK
jgi:tetratricopeptide (TPR) repeat protein